MKQLATGWATGARFETRAGIFIFATASNSALGSIQLPVQWKERVISRGYNGRRVKPTTHLHLIPRLNCAELQFYSPIRLHGVVLTCPGQLYLNNNNNVIYLL
jgi:hypothetical protein